MSLVPAGPSGPLSQGGISEVSEPHGCIYLLHSLGVGAHEWVGQVGTAQIPAGLVVTSHSY